MAYYILFDRTIAQAVSRRLPTAAPWVRAQVRSCGFRGGLSGIGADFLPSTSVFPDNLHSTYCSTLIIIIYHPGLWPTYQVGLVSPHPKKLKKNTSYFLITNGF
jgi:hypothetical protein